MWLWPAYLLLTFEFWFHNFSSLISPFFFLWNEIYFLLMLQADAKTIRFREKVLKKGGIWKDIYGTDEKKVADMVRQDQVDILIELTGHTANNKLGMLACRPAPVQVFLTSTYLDFFPFVYQLVTSLILLTIFSVFPLSLLCSMLILWICILLFCSVVSVGTFLEKVPLYYATN